MLWDEGGFAMAQSIKLIVYPVRDLAASKALFSKFLGVEPYAESDYYVGFRVDGQEVGLDPNARSQGMTAPIGYVEVSEISSALQALLDAGAELQQDVRDVGGGKMVATVKDADGNIIGLVQSP